MKKIKFEKLTELFRGYNKTKTEFMPDIIAYIVFSRSNWRKQYPLKARTYRVSSASSWFKSENIGNCLIGDSLDGIDKDVRIDAYFGKWEIEYCYIEEESNSNNGTS